MRRFKGLALRTRPLRRNGRAAMGQNPAYRAFVRTFGCVACYGCLQQQGEGEIGTIWKIQKSLTECAHVGRRGIGQKCPDCESLPLCAIEHHRVGPESHHRLGKRFWAFHGLDRVALIQELQRLYALESTSTALPKT